MPYVAGCVLRSNAPVQLRAVGPTGAEGAAISISVQAFNRNDFPRSRARQLQRVLGFTPLDPHRTRKPTSTGTMVRRSCRYRGIATNRPLRINPR